MARARFPLSTILTHELASHNNENSCYVSIGTRVYDVTSFLSDHPGGGDLILEYGGKDVSKIMADELSHAHSEVAYEILHNNLIGFVANETTIESIVEHDPPDDIVPMPPKAGGAAAVKDYAATARLGVEDLSKETDRNADFRTHRFLNLDKPLLPQVWNGGFSRDFYLEQVYRPRYYARGDSAPLFGNFLEPLSRTAWYVVPLVWLPPVVFWTFLANQGMVSVIRTVEYVLIGLMCWPLVEYWVHRTVHDNDRFVLAPEREVCVSWLI